MTAAHAWLPRATCDSSCVGVGPASSRWRVVLRVTLRVMLAVLLAPGVPLVLVPLPGQLRVQRFY
ncbi:MAG TPA: 1-acyl-sn-glycerol-3-phosphate acyltransferase, partial [Mycobacterium sp.]|nr:1-acyl-sn-glycerol-3-phosphate acyltransferase [Mycobacterium sp.]